MKTLLDAANLDEFRHANSLGDILAPAARKAAR
jgi:hypothetical protein